MRRKNGNLAEFLKRKDVVVQIQKRTLKTAINCVLQVSKLLGRPKNIQILDPSTELNFATEYFLLVFSFCCGGWGEILEWSTPQEKSLLYNTEVAYFIELIDRYFEQDRNNFYAGGDLDSALFLLSTGNNVFSHVVLSLKNALDSWS